MKILWLHSHFLNWMGGTKFVYEVVARLRDRAQIVVAVEATSERARSAYGEMGVELTEVSNKTANSVTYWLSLPRHIHHEALALECSSQDADVVVSSMFPMNCVAARLARPTVQLCYEPFSFFYDENFIRGFPLAKRLFIRWLGFRYTRYDIEATRRSGIVLTLSEERREWIQQVYGRDAEVIYMGVDSEFFSPKPNAELEQRYAGKKVILHSTDFTSIKGTDWLIKALPNVVDQIPDALLVVTTTIEDPAGLARLKRLATSLGVWEHIHVLGFVDYEMLPCYYTLADVVVQPSIRQSHSLSVKEAMACGTSVIRSLDTLEEVVDGESGYLVDPTDTRVLAERIVALLHQPGLAAEMGRKARERIVKDPIGGNYSWDSVADKVWDAIIRAAES